MRRNYKREIDPKENRQLPCFTWVCTGDCMYQHKCRFVHPSNIQNNEKTSITLKSKKREKSGHVDDTFFWPKMENRTNDIMKEYELPIPDKNIKHDIYLFSIWKHYTLTTQMLNRENDKNTKLCKYSLSFLKQTTFDPYYIENKYTQSNRLSVFVQLSKSKSIEK